MEYVFGTKGEIEVLRTKGAEHSDLTGYNEVTREYPDQKITDRFLVVRKLDSQEDPEGNCYDWYEIDRHYRFSDKTNPLNEKLENTAAISAQISVAARLFVQEATTIEDSDALQMPDLFRSWDDALSAGSALTANTVINKGGTLYRVVQSVTPLESQPPDMAGMLAIYRPIEPSHAGTQEDPVPWVYGMDCTTGLYYSYGGVTYRCAGDMVPCVWEPGTAGVWQWEETE